MGREDSAQPIRHLTMRNNLDTLFFFFKQAEEASFKTYHHPHQSESELYSEQVAASNKAAEDIQRLHIRRKPLNQMSTQELAEVEKERKYRNETERAQREAVRAPLDQRIHESIPSR